MSHEPKELMVTSLTKPRTMERGYLNPKGVRRLLDEHFQSWRDQSRIWRQLMLDWYHNFVEARPFESEAAETSVGERV